MTLRSSLRISSLLSVGVCVALLTACSSESATPKTAVAQGAVAKGDAAKSDAAKSDAAKGDAAKGDAAKGDAAKDADAEGCIYVDGTKGKDDLECPHPPKPGTEAAEPDAPPNGDGHFGQTFAIDEAVPLTKALAAVAEAPVRVSGEVEAVCQKKGCWMVIKDGTESARVLMKDHAFAVPMDCRGKKVQIEGTLASRTFTEKQVKHLAKDGGRNPDEVSGERTEHVLTATGISIQS